MSQKVAARREPILPEQLFTGAAGTLPREIRFSHGDFLYRQGDLADALYLLRSGRIRLSVTAPTGKEATLSVLGAGEIFGERCLVPGSRRVASASAMCQGTAIRVSGDRLRAMMAHDSEIADFVLGRILPRMNRYEEALVHQIINNTERRLARVLLHLSDYDGSSQPKVIKDISQEVLAAMVGASRPRVNGFMTKFRRQGLIEYGGNEIRVRPALVTVLLAPPPSAPI